MKRLPILFLLLFLCQSCEKDLPSTTTIVKGNLVDENNNPLANIPFSIFGFYYKGISAIPSFDETAYTDKEGNFTFGQLISSPTKYVQIAPVNDYTDKVFFYERENGVYSQWKGEILFIKIGSENIINFKLVKR